MSKRETHLMSIYFIANKGAYETHEEAIKVANALKNHLEYLRTRGRDFYINAFIGISNVNVRYGHLKYVNKKSVGKRRLEVVPKKKYKDQMEKCFEPWHLHILIEANPAETIGEIVVRYFNRKFGRKIAFKKKVSEGFFDYVFNQSRYQRFVKESRSTRLVEFDFKKEFEKYKRPKSNERIEHEKQVMKALEERSLARHKQKLQALSKS